MSFIKYKKVMSKKEGGEYVISLPQGDLFISFHYQNENCMAFFLRKSDLNSTEFEFISKQVSDYFSSIPFSSIEIKLIGSKESISLIDDFFLKNGFSFLKRIEKEHSVDVVFEPSVNKVRVSKENKPNVVNLPHQSSLKHKVLIVDDSKTIRTILSRIFTSDKNFEVCAMADKPSEVEALILKHKPDVITMDIHMPEMDGVALLKYLVPKYNIPIVMISSISMAEGPMVLEALENGAIDYIQKPEMSEIDRVTPIILEKVKTAAIANMTQKPRNKRRFIEQTKLRSNLNSLVVVGSSTGGTEALREILTALPNEIPPTLIVQHIPPVFSAAFAKRMNDLCPFEVKEAENGDEIRANRVLIAPGGKQMRMITKQGKAFVEINDDEPMNRFKPSVDYLFYSVAQSLYTNTIAVLLTGMGKDGAKGMLELKRLGVRTIAQDENSSVVFGMPKEAIALGAAEFVEPLNCIPERITQLTCEKITIKKIG